MAADNPSSSGQTTANKGTKPEVWVAIIGAVATITVALLSFPPLIARFTPALTSTPTSSLTSLPTNTLMTGFTSDTNTPESLPVFTETGIPVPPVLTTDTPSLPLGMHVRLFADKTSGKAPLTVKLDARESFLRAQGGEIYGCKSGACEYTWEVYSGGQKVGKAAHNSTGTFQYTFGKKGSYFITVWVCRGGGSSDCNGSGAQIEVK